MYNELKNQIITGLLSSPVIYIPHFHYELVDEVITEILSPKSGRKILELGIEDICEFDIKLGIIDFVTKCPDRDWSIKLEALLEGVVSGKRNSVNDKKVFLIKNADKILCSEEVQALLQLFAQKYERGDYNTLYTIILVSASPVSSLPKGMDKVFTIIDVLPPTVNEIKDYVIKCVGEDYCGNKTKKRVLDDLVRTLQGLQMYEVKQTLKTVLSLTNGHINGTAIRIALREKKNIVKKSGIIEVVDNDISFEDIGGLGRLIKDLNIKSQIYKNLGDAVKYNVPIPKGILIIGMPGCGKSMIAQATANKFNVSLLRLDISRLMGKYVGESEANLREALATAEAAHPCVLWIDEIEKAFAGTNNSGGDNDMLVMRMMGYFLTWMQERKTPVYIVATANDVMRPEFMRKGRFDEVYFVDFPNEEERAQILLKKIQKRYSNSKEGLFDFSEIGDCKEVVKSMIGKYGGFSGSEVECVLNMVVEEKFYKYLVDKSNSGDSDEMLSKIVITKADFEKAVENIKDSVMANQQSKKTNSNESNKTVIERIRDMQGIYKFPNAKG